MLKMTRLSNLAPEELKTDKIVEDNSKADNKTLIKKSKNAKSRSQIHIGAMGEPIFLIPDAKETFN